MALARRCYQLTPADRWYVGEAERWRTESPDGSIELSSNLGRVAFVGGVDQHPRGESRLRRVLNKHPSIAAGACIVWGGLFFAATERGTVGLSESRPDVLRAMLVFIGVDQDHRGSDGWVFVGFALTLMFLALIGWVALAALKNRGGASRE